MVDLAVGAIETYLASLFEGEVHLLGMSQLGSSPKDEPLKGHGYGAPVLLEYEVGGRRRRAVLETMSAGPNGHEHMADRAQVHLWSHQAYGRLPRHVSSIDVGAFRRDGSVVSLGAAEELFVLMDFVDGTGYFRDLERLRDGGPIADLDRERCDALCDYLIRIHSMAGGEPGLYVRRIRELVGHGECIMGIADSYPGEHPEIPDGFLEEVEQRAVAWRWHLKGRTGRLRQVHGDFHPWNLLFRDGSDFSVIDRSRGEWGDPADDVTCLAANYLFFSLQRSGRLEGVFAELWDRFWDRYLEGSGDRELLEVAAPFFAFRALVMASPVWYPTLPRGVRGALLRFIRNVLDEPVFDPSAANRYCAG